MKPLTPSTRSHLLSAMAAVINAVVFHVLMWAFGTLLYAHSESVLRFILPLIILAVEMVVYLVLRAKLPKKNTFCGILLLAHAFLAALVLVSAIPEWLTTLAGKNFAVECADEVPMPLYLFYVWTATGPLAFVLYFLVMVTENFVEILRGAFGFPPRSDKNSRE